ncbi:uncharacterized protein [Montipora foliosa]|uniref:uncharacterized protein n=1 Tax=Montipora foliosa TaxID=591990 RepID=UPI0035F20125
MNSFILILVPLMVFAFPNALALTCYKCTPSLNPLRTCTEPEQLTSMECPTPNVNMSMNMSGVIISLTYDVACLTTRFVANVPNLGQLTVYSLGCGTQNNGSSASMPDCSISQSSICEAIEKAVIGTGITIVSCNNTCCTTDNCNEVEQPSTTPSTNEEMTPSTNEEMTMASTTSGMDQVRPQFLGLLMVFAGILFRKIYQPF